MSLLCLPCGKFSLPLLAVPAGKDSRVECPCQTGKFESIYDSDAYPEDVRYEYVALEELTTRFRISFNYQLEKMPDNAQRDVILEIIQKHKDYLASLEAALADDKEQTA